MAWFFGDGFDLYSNVSDMALGYWDSVSGGSFVNGRFSLSRAYAMGNATTGLIKSSGNNDALHHIFFSAMQSSNISGSGNYLYFTFSDAGTAQCTVLIQSNGNMFLQSGGVGGTVLATYNGAITARDVWNSFEVEVFISNTAGYMNVRKNGNTVNDFSSATNLNTRPGTTNNYANRIQISGQNVPSMQIDDFLWRSDPTTVPWVGDIRCFTRRPASDASVQWSRTTGSFTQFLWGRISSQTYGANTAVYSRVISQASGAPITGIVIDCNVTGGGGVGNLKAALFADDNNTVGALLGTSNEVINPGATNVTVTFPTPIRVTPGVPFWVGINQSVSMTYGVINSTSVTPPTNCTYVTAPYASWPPAYAGVGTGTSNLICLSLVYTPQFNYDCISDMSQDALNSYVYSGVPSNVDLYTITPTPSTPTIVYGVVTRGLLQKGDAGTRTAAIQLRSGSTTVESSTVALNTVFGWISRTDVVDPATGAAWTPGAVNNAYIGVIVKA